MTTPSEKSAELSSLRAEVQRLARQAAEAGCDWASGDLQVYFDECTETQRVDMALLPQVLDYWRARFQSACADPGQRRPPYISLLQAREVVRTADSRIRNLSVRDPGRVREVIARYQAAGDDREKALLLEAAEAASQMLPPGLVLQAPEPPVAEAAALIQRLRGAGIGLSLNASGQIEVHGVLSESQRHRIRALRAEIVAFLSQPTEIL